MKVLLWFEPCRGPDLSARQPLLRDRSPIDYSMVTFWSASEGLAAGAIDLRLRPRPHHFQLPAREPDKNSVGRLCRATRRVPRFCPPRRHIVPLHECSGALLHWLSRGYRRAARRFPDGFQRLVRSLSRWPLVHVRCPSQRAANRPHLDGARARCNRRRDCNLIWPVYAGGLQSHHRGSHVGRSPERMTVFEFVPG